MVKKNLWNLTFILSIFLIDRLTKFFFINMEKKFGEVTIEATTFLNFNLIWNDGIAFGLFSFDQKIYYNLMTLIIVLSFMLLSTFIILLELSSSKLEVGSSSIITGLFLYNALASPIRCLSPPEIFDEF